MPPFKYRPFVKRGNRYNPAAKAYKELPENKRQPPEQLPSQVLIDFFNVASHPEEYLDDDTTCRSDDTQRIYERYRRGGQPDPRAVPPKRPRHTPPEYSDLKLTSRTYPGRGAAGGNR